MARGRRTGWMAEGGRRAVGWLVMAALSGLLLSQLVISFANSDAATGQDGRIHHRPSETLRDSWKELATRPAE